MRQKKMKKTKTITKPALPVGKGLQPTDTTLLKPAFVVHGIGFCETKDGIFTKFPKVDWQKIASHIQVISDTRNVKSLKWGRQFQWIDRDGQMHTAIFSRAGSVATLCGLLLEGGLAFVSGKAEHRSALRDYILHIPVERCLRVATKIGWQRDGSYVLPNFAITPEGNEEIVYDGDLEVARWGTSGTAAEWRDQVGRFCSGNSRLLFAVSCAFAGPLLRLCDGEGGGFHLHGGSSTGKTTLLRLAGSVLGGGSRHGFTQPWRTTTAALESIASAHNDAALLLDELSQLDAADVANVAYLLGNGMGRSRRGPGRKLQERDAWRLLAVSTGEGTAAEHAGTAGKRLHRGAEVRMVNLAADAGCGLGVFEELHGFESGQVFADALSLRSLKYYGSAFWEFLRFVVRHQEPLREALLQYQLDFCADLAPRAPGMIARVAARFAMVAFAARVATQIGLTGWETGEAEAAAQRLFLDWASTGDDGCANCRAATDRLRAMLSDGARRFSSVRQAAIEIDDRAGYTRIGKAGNREYLIFPEVFDGEICDGFLPRAVAQELERGGHLRGEAGRPTAKVRLPGHANPVRVYCVRESILREGEGPHVVLAAK
jgi:putative DNA primase/helicase